MKAKILPAVLFFWISSTSPVFALSDEGFKKLELFSRILHYVETQYVEAPNEKRLLEGAIRGMLSTLDPHTVYLSPDVYKHLKDDTSGTFGGVGLEITVRDGWVTVVTPIDGSPAQTAGIHPGDRILKINGKPTKGMDLGTAVQEMRGAKGKKVTLTLGRKDSAKPFEVSLTRQTIRAPSVQAEILDGKYLYVKISSFQERTGNELRKILKDHEKDVFANGLIMDLRNNPGGLLNQAVEVSDQFIDKGLIVYTSSREKEIDRREATPYEGSKIYPMIVMVNGGSASAAEIVAGALQDHKRALILGTQSFGKGSVQSVLELDDGSALKLTIARYYTPKGQNIQDHGITPDLVVEPIPPETVAEVKEESKKSETLDLPKDYQKEQALARLKNWQGFQKK